jgi:hypothetical protein
MRRLSSANVDVVMQELSALCRVDIEFSTRPHTSARDAWNTGMDFVVGECNLKIHSQRLCRQRGGLRRASGQQDRDVHSTARPAHHVSTVCMQCSTACTLPTVMPAARRRRHPACRLAVCICIMFLMHMAAVTRSATCGPCSLWATSRRTAAGAATPTRRPRRTTRCAHLTRER